MCTIYTRVFVVSHWLGQMLMSSVMNAEKKKPPSQLFSTECPHLTLPAHISLTNLTMPTVQNPDVPWC